MLHVLDVASERERHDAWQLVRAEAFSSNTVGDVTASTPYWDGCSTIVDQVGNQVTWSNFRCSAGCWLEQFQCGTARAWTSCRSWGDFSGAVSGSRLTGTQIETFEAMSGDARYIVRAEVRYDLERH